jgi:hypothetical protein
MLPSLIKAMGVFLFLAFGFSLIIGHRQFLATRMYSRS